MPGTPRKRRRAPLGLRIAGAVLVASCGSSVAGVYLLTRFRDLDERSVSERINGDIGLLSPVTRTALLRKDYAEFAGLVRDGKTKGVRVTVILPDARSSPSPTSAAARESRRPSRVHPGDAHRAGTSERRSVTSRTICLRGAATRRRGRTSARRAADRAAARGALAVDSEFLGFLVVAAMLACRRCVHRLVRGAADRAPLET